MNLFICLKGKFPIVNMDKLRHTYIRHLSIRSWIYSACKWDLFFLFSWPDHMAFFHCLICSLCLRTSVSIVDNVLAFCCFYSLESEHSTNSEKLISQSSILNEKNRLCWTKLLSWKLPKIFWFLAGNENCIEVLLEQKCFRKFIGNPFTPLHCAM